MTEDKKRTNGRARQRRARQRRNRRILLTACLMALVMVFSIGGTIAWLTDKTEEAKNTFTVGDINIQLKETTSDYKIVPGVDIPKDPKVTVEAGSEDCWLFVKVEEANWPTVTEADGTTRKVNYGLAEEWELVPSETNVYARKVSTSTNAQDFPVLADNQVTVSGNLTKAEMDKITTNPTLTFTAYACQLKKDANTEFTAAEAWEKISNDNTNP